MNEGENRASEDDGIALLLQLAGPREKLPDAMKDSWEATFRRELRLRRHNRWGVKKSWLAGIAATIALCAAGLTWVFSAGEPVTGAPVTVTALLGSSALSGPGGEKANLVEGMRLTPGSVIQTGKDSRVGLNYGGYSLRLDRNSRAILRPSSIHLSAGRLYAGDSAQRIGHTQLTVTTAQGSVSDIGTQFIVQVSEEGTTAIVRRGIIKIAAGSSEFLIKGKPGLAAQFSIGADGDTQSREVPASGDGWHWIYSVSEPFELEGKSIYSFLQWSVSESGLELEFASAAAEVYARRVVLHGSVGELDPERVIAPVLQATDLQAKPEGHALLVSLREE